MCIRDRLYTLRSLGRAGEMDVASSDNTQIHWSETMTLLLPLVVFGQLMQGYQAFFLFRLYRAHPTEVQILLLFLLFAANFAGNTSTTMQVLLDKRSTNHAKAVRQTRPKRSASSPSFAATAAAPNSRSDASNVGSSSASTHDKQS